MQIRCSLYVCMILSKDLNTYKNIKKSLIKIKSHWPPWEYLYHITALFHMKGEDCTADLSE